MELALGQRIFVEDPSQVGQKFRIGTIVGMDKRVVEHHKVTLSEESISDSDVEVISTVSSRVKGFYDWKYTKEITEPIYLVMFSCREPLFAVKENILGFRNRKEIRDNMLVNPTKEEPVKKDIEATVSFNTDSNCQSEFKWESKSMWAAFKKGIGYVAIIIVASILLAVCASIPAAAIKYLWKG